MPPYSSQIVTGYDIIPITPGAANFSEGPCRALWVEGFGTVDITTLGADGKDTDRDGVPIENGGLFPVQCIKVRAITGITSVWAIY